QHAGFVAELPTRVTHPDRRAIPTNQLDLVTTQHLARFEPVPPDLSVRRVDVERLRGQTQQLIGIFEPEELGEGGVGVEDLTGETRAIDTHGNTFEQPAEARL